MLLVFTRNRRRVPKSLSFLLFMESRRIFLIQQYLNHLKNLAMVDHFIRKKTRKKLRSCCGFVKIMAGGKLFETRITIPNFMKDSA